MSAMLHVILQATGSQSAEAIICNSAKTARSVGDLAALLKADHLLKTALGFCPYTLLFIHNL